MELFLKLLIAHLLGDFVLQPYSWVQDKNLKKLRSPRLYLHTGVHLILTLLMLSTELSLWYLAVIIAITHFLIDAMKLKLQNEKNGRLLFFIDQLLHLLVIIVIALFFVDTISLPDLNNSQWFTICGLLFLTQPASIIIKTLISVYTPKTEMEADDSLQNAGKYIGIIERILVLIFIMTNHWEGVGFLIAAKSIFRFSDLTQAKDRKLTEYILIGTLLSFGFAIVTGLIVMHFVRTAA
ncbi:DUF3307 domain-containing protein [Robertkochia solimangrovi]|uniref:DUF3307 domain-containing protein n=1 Tax=Robertkochia solimangrovi TaxID=2213046 RepID=UPI00117FE218|nr:DUF3307 domain-containing protein [Robertkochia solimangrovi]TRZ43668.1 DUF3307 domain-containing protein [Robertkochia solimangrovi]